MAIAFVYAVGTAIGGITGPLLFGKLVATKDVGQVFWGYILGASLMIARYRRALGIAERRGDILRSGRSRFVAG